MARKRDVNREAAGTRLRCFGGPVEIGRTFKQVFRGRTSRTTA